MRYWEDFEVGSTETFGAYEITEAEIIEFGAEYDPAPFHVDAKAAADGPYGGLIAPGLLVGAAFMRMLVDHVLLDSASMGSPGIDSARWKIPVRPGDTLSVRQEALNARVLQSRPELGLVNNRFEILNQRGEIAAEICSTGLFRRRHTDEAGA